MPSFEPEWLPRAAELRARGWGYDKISREIGEAYANVYYHLQRGRYGRRACVECGEEFEPARAEHKACSPRCGAAASHRRAAESGRASAAKKGRANPRYKHGQRAGVRDRRGERRFVDQRSCRHPACRRAEHAMNQHHVVYRQEVRRLGGDVWDPDNALTLCNGCHSSHHNRGALVVPLSALRDENYAFAVALMGAGPAYGDVPLDRTYGEGS
jgi:5-methylcytosine-specific restriction endonuclease McrA